MKKDDLLKQIADTAYNVGFGAKKHFATFDLVDKTPGRISFITMAVGIFALFVDALNTKHLSATFIVLGISGLYASFFDDKKHVYEENGILLTKLFNQLKALYFEVKSADGVPMDEYAKRLVDIESAYYEISISKQIFLSDWYAHYKFFWQHQIDWIDEQKNFRFWRDKVPLSLTIFAALVLAAIAIGIAAILIERGMLG